MLKREVLWRGGMVGPLRLRTHSTQEGVGGCLAHGAMSQFTRLIRVHDTNKEARIPSMKFRTRKNNSLKENDLR